MVKSDPLTRHLQGLPAVRVIYTDLDGTLLGRGGALLKDAQGRPSISTAAALVAAARKGIAVVAVSGRRAASLAQDVRLLGLDGAIAEVGTVIIRDGTHHFEWGRCPPDLALTPRGALEEAGALSVLMGSFEGELRPYAPWDAGREGGYLLHGLISVDKANAVLEETGIGWAKVVDNGRTGGWEGRDDVHAYHLVPHGVGKAVALADDLQDRGFTADQAMAIGDSEEDQTMAAEVGTYVIVANGHGTAGDNRFRVRGRNGDGVADAITAALDAADRR